MPPPPPPPPPPQVAQAGETAKSVIKRTESERAKRDAGAFIFFTSNEANSWGLHKRGYGKTITFLRRFGKAKALVRARAFDVRTGAGNGG
jgi:hypothetical protein